MMTDKKLAVTMGDASGVGPEVYLKAYLSGRLADDQVLYGDAAIMQRAQEILGLDVPLHIIDDIDHAVAGRCNVIDCKLLAADDLTPGEINKKSGAAARAYVVRASEEAVAGKNAGLVTLPMNKEATQLTDPNFCGHTELIAGIAGTENFTMMLTTPEVAVAHVSTHVAVAQAVHLVKKKRIVEVIQLVHESLGRFIDKPRIAVAGLNPHAGENGLFGREEIEEIQPAIAQAQALGIDASGPYPADTVFFMAIKKDRFDAIIAMYHDQGHVPMKLIAFEKGVNVTVGMPIVRCSVDHGTAFDIAYTGVADYGNFIEAYNYAKRLCKMP